MSAALAGGVILAAGGTAFAAEIDNVGSGSGEVSTPSANKVISGGKIKTEKSTQKDNPPGSGQDEKDPKQNGKALSLAEKDKDHDTKTPSSAQKKPLSSVQKNKEQDTKTPTSPQKDQAHTGNSGPPNAQLR
ncbi:MAG: hypothetical protein ACRDTX_25485 [Pseudonocardiaceae bacterium]